MGSILKRRRKDGTIGYTAIVRVKKAGVIIHSETDTFDREQAAKSWITKREAALALPGALDKPNDPPLADVIKAYNEDKKRPHGKTKDQVLRFIAASDLGKMPCSQVTSQELVKFAKSFTDQQPSTVANYLSHLASVMAIARPAWGYPLDSQAMDDARIVLTKMGIIGKSKERTRRPTIAELNKLMEHFTIVERHANRIPMTKIMVFALYSTRRLDEITKILYSDLQAEHSEIMVRDMKNPGEKIGNNVVTTLTPEALKMIEIHGSKVDRIWKFNGDSISTAFTRACQFLEIADLHFHDLRHEGITRLFEMGWSIPRVACVSGHRSWKTLQRYTQYRQAGDKYADWVWKTKLLGPCFP